MKHTDEPMHQTAIASLPRIELPPLSAPTAREIERRKAVVERIRHRRERIGPIGIRSDELLHEAEKNE